MMPEDEKRAVELLPESTWTTCARCGGNIPQFAFPDTCRKEISELIEKRRRLEAMALLQTRSGCDLQTAKAWVAHYEDNDRKVAVPCPRCGEPLRTPNAKQCRHCHHDWHDS